MSVEVEVEIGLSAFMSQFVDRYARASEMRLWALATMNSRPPDFRIGPGYMDRWFLIPRNEFANVYLHRVMRSDDDRALHDHPWPNQSILLEGRYLEIMPEHPRGLWREPGDSVKRLATDRHRLVLEPGTTAVSLFITGPKVRDWGFWCGENEDRFVPWQDFTAPGNKGLVGRGCGG